jgi:hypothetical protein
MAATIGESSNAKINNNGNASNGVNQFNYDVAQNVCGYVNGPQTPKPIQPPLEIWNKLRFWFNEDVRLSIPSVSIPYGQRFITINLNEADNLLSESPSIFLESIQTVGVLPIITTQQAAFNDTSTVNRTVIGGNLYNIVLAKDTPSVSMNFTVTGIVGTTLTAGIASYNLNNITYDPLANTLAAKTGVNGNVVFSCNKSVMYLPFTVVPIKYPPDFSIGANVEKTTFSASSL